MTHDWQPQPERTQPQRMLDRCTICGAYRITVSSPDGKRIFFRRYSRQDANIDDTLRWSWEAPPCKQIQPVTVS